MMSAAMKLRTGYRPPTRGPESRLGAPRFSGGLQPSEFRPEAHAHILGALSVLASYAPYPARLTVPGEITAIARRCWAYGREQISEWRRRARDRRELLMLSERELADVRVEIRRARDAAENEASKLFYRG